MTYSDEEEMNMNCFPLQMAAFFVDLVFRTAQRTVRRQCWLSPDQFKRYQQLAGGMIWDFDSVDFLSPRSRT